KTIAGNTEDRSNFETLKNLLSEYLSVAEKIRASIDQGKKDEAISVMNGDTVQIDQSIRDQLDKIVAFNINSAKNERVTANQHYRNTFHVLLWISLIGGLLSLAFGLYLSKLITTSVNVVVQCIKRMALGDYTTSIDIHSKDEIGVMASELNRMIDNTEQIVGNILKSSEHVGSGSHEIASGNQDLSQRTQEQAATLEEVASSVEEITLSMQKTAANSEQAEQLAESTMGVVREGEQSIGETIDAMHQITESSRQIAEIIKVVNDIAFQTNLLALNAAVEAARAGEQGRGFAVVAAEVRNLAGRAGESSKAIERLIKDSVQRVERGNEMVLRSGDILKQIVQNTKNTSDVIIEITSAMRSQSSASQQIQTAIEQLNQVTQQNAAMVEEIATSSEVLGNEATELYETVSVFRIKNMDKAPKIIGSKRNNDRPALTGPANEGTVKDRDFQADDLERF
ncbi:MAG TPA: methyl-accepting chemotaxis protein, partial [Bacillota bacterium]|nr:methyl-accepting chemotaxis protein [Bacillota bacterium]